MEGSILPKNFNAEYLKETKTALDAIVVIKDRIADAYANRKGYGPLHIDMYDLQAKGFGYIIKGCITTIHEDDPNVEATLDDKGILVLRYKE
jgi:hypothetical protein